MRISCFLGNGSWRLRGIFNPERIVCAQWSARFLRGLVGIILIWLLRSLDQNQMLLLVKSWIFSTFPRLHFSSSGWLKGMLHQVGAAFCDIHYSVTVWVALWTLRIRFGVMQQLQTIIISASFLEQFCAPSSRYGRCDSLQVVGTSHSFAVLVNSWAIGAWVVLLVKCLCCMGWFVEWSSVHYPKWSIGCMLIVWLSDK